MAKGKKADLGILSITSPPMLIIRTAKVREHLGLPSTVDAVMPHIDFDELRDVILEEFTLDKFDIEDEELPIPIRVTALVELPRTEEDAKIGVH